MDAARYCTAPALFVHGEEDYFVVEEHTIKNFDAYAGEDKIMRKCQGDHTSDRPNDIIMEILTFFRKNMLDGTELPQGITASREELIKMKPPLFPTEMIQKPLSPRSQKEAEEKASQIMNPEEMIKKMTD